MAVTDAIKDKSVRKYKDANIDPDKVKKCENATLAPNSSNMQLQLFTLLIKNIKKIAHACFNQNAAKTSKNMVVLLPEEINGDLEQENLNFQKTYLISKKKRVLMLRKEEFFQEDTTKK